MNRRAFLGSGLASLFVGVFALLMGGGLPRQSQRLRRRGPVEITLSEGAATLGTGTATILKSWDGKPLQETEPLTDIAYGYYDSDPRVNGPEDIEAFQEAWQNACREHGHAVDVSTLRLGSPHPGRQFGIG